MPSKVWLCKAATVAGSAGQEQSVSECVLQGCCCSFIAVKGRGPLLVLQPLCLKTFETQDHCLQSTSAPSLLRQCLLLLQAFWRAFSSLFGGGIQFKTTLKGASMLMNSTLRDLWMPGLMFFLMLASLIDGLVQLFRSEFSKCCPWLQLPAMTGMVHGHTHPIHCLGLCWPAHSVMAGADEASVSMQPAQTICLAATWHDAEQASCSAPACADGASATSSPHQRDDSTQLCLHHLTQAALLTARQVTRHILVPSPQVLTLPEAHTPVPAVLCDTDHMRACRCHCQLPPGHQCVLVCVQWHSPFPHCLLRLCLQGAFPGLGLPHLHAPVLCDWRTGRRAHVGPLPQAV